MAIKNSSGKQVVKNIPKVTGGVGSGGSGGSSGAWGGSTYAKSAPQPSWWSGLWPGTTTKQATPIPYNPPSSGGGSSSGGTKSSSGGGGGGWQGQPRTLASSAPVTPYHDVVEASAAWTHSAGQAATTNAPLAAVRPEASVPPPLQPLTPNRAAMASRVVSEARPAPISSATRAPDPGGPQAGGGWTPPRDVSTEGVSASVGGQSRYTNGRGFRG